MMKDVIYMILDYYEIMMRCWCGEHTSVMLSKCLLFGVLFKGSFAADVMLMCNLFVVASAVPIIAESCFSLIREICHGIVCLKANRQIE